MSDYRHWTSDEEKYIQDHWRLQTDGEMAAALDRSEGAVRTKRRELRCSPQKTWTPEELQYLEDHWGTVSIPGIAKKLGRTVNAIKVRVARMGLGGMLNSGDYVTFNQLMRELTDNSQSYSYQMKSWVKNRGMPIHTKRVNACSFRVVYLEEFWEWAEQHRSFIDFSKLEPLALGKEPDWVAEQRRKDYQSFALQRKDPWSPDEDNNLIRLLKQQKYGYAELSEILRRSEGAIVRRCRDLGLKERPVRADSHRKGGSWSDEQHQILADGIHHGDSYSMIGRVIGKSEKALRGKIYFTYLTEDADKVRAMLGDGPWGHGAPEPTVRQGFSLSKTRTEVRKNLSILDALLRKRMNDLGYDPYWQRFMCANWDPVKGCSADCADCDSCTEFQRIRPQYCRMCGGEFLERKEQTYSRSAGPCGRNKPKRNTPCSTLGAGTDHLSLIHHERRRKMAKCKICGKAVVTAHVFHRECWQEEVEKLAQVFCDNYCRWPRECPNQDELEDKHCDSCDLIRVLNLGL